MAMKLSDAVVTNHKGSLKEAVRATVKGLGKGGDQFIIDALSRYDNNGSGLVLAPTSKSATITPHSHT